MAGSFSRAATGIVNLGVAGAAAVGAAALQSWPLAALGGVTYVALVAWDYARGGSKGPKEPEKAAFLDLKKYKDPQTQGSVRAVLAAKGEIDRVLAETNDEVKASLALALVSVDGLMERAAGLAKRGEDLSSYLSTKDPRVVRYDVESLAQRAAQATDPEARAQYESARAAREEHLKSLDDLTAARERVLASLLSIASSLEGLPAKIVHLRALDADAIDKQSGDVNEELDRVNGEMRSFEETLRTLGEA
jgi:hypothetical protein